MEQVNLIPGIQGKVIEIAILSKDALYKQDIINYYESINNIRMFDVGDSFEAFAERLNGSHIDLLLVDHTGDINVEKNVDLLKDSDIKKVIMITSQLIDIPIYQEENIEIQFMYKYSPYHLITQQMILFYFNTEQRNKSDHKFNEAIKKIHKQKRVVFYSPKGGTGKSITAVNTACHLVLKGQKVLIVDFSQFSSLSVLFQTVKSNNLGEAISLLEQSVADEITLKEAIKKSICEIEIQPEKKLYLLTAASHFKMANLTLSMTDKLLEQIQSFDFDTIICDTSSEISAKNISLLSWATDLFLLTSTDVVVNWQLFTAQDFLQQIQNPFQTQYLILNRFNSSHSINKMEIEQILSKNIAEMIPDFDSQLQNYINRGVLLISKPNLKIHKHFKRIAHMIHPVFTAKELGIGKRRFRRSERV